MWKLFGNKKKRYKLTNPGRIIIATLVVVGLFLIAPATHDLLTAEREYSAARDEYDILRELYPVMSAYLEEFLQNPALDSYSSRNSGSSPSAQAAIVPGGSSGYDSANQALSGEEQPDPLAGLMELNPDFEGWILIEDVLSYPVVRGRDNDYYVSRTFSKESNFAGSIFMDYRSRQGFDSNISVLYGHNMKDGSMFAALHHYRDRAFLAEHPEIFIVTSSGDVLVYRIYAVSFTDVWEKEQDLSYPNGAASVAARRNAPEGTSNFLILSTCTREGSESGVRLRVFAALVS